VVLRCGERGSGVERSEYENGMTSKKLAEVIYGGTSPKAGGVWEGLGKTLLNNFCMGKKIEYKREQDGVEGEKGGS